MLSYTNLAALLLSLPSVVVSLSQPTLLTQFSPSVRIENLTILPNSTIIVCNAFTGELYGVNPLHGPSGASPYFVTSFAPYSDAIFGLTSPAPYTIAATASNFSWADGEVVQGSNTIHLVDLTEAGPKTTSFSIPSAAWLNGLTTAPGASHYLLVADCIAGALLRLDTRTGAVETVSSDPLFASVAGSEIPIGINGVHALDGWLYFTNTDQGLYGRLAITAEGLPIGTPAEVIAYGINGSSFDDFALRGDGTAFLATGLAVNGIEEITETGDALLVAEWEFGSTEISQAVSGVFGQTKRDRGILYFATAGQYLGTDTDPSGAQLFALQVDC
ncbi:hypothetical protein BX600DRAFT_438689 [Xylariales sp. PMI_506]|nr:hypothetical protein BX600DRAFT_438689 [Xylariales sp. PMI_506]